MRDLIWIAGATIASLALFLLFGDALIFTLIGFVAVARAALGLFAEYREKKLYRELEDLDYEERRKLLEEAGEQGLVNRSPPP